MKLTRIVLMFAKQQRESSLEVVLQWKFTSANQCCYFTL